MTKRTTCTNASPNPKSIANNVKSSASLGQLYERTLSVLETIIRDQLIWSLDQVCTRRDGQSIDLGKNQLAPDLWIACVASFPTSTQCVIEPRVIAEICLTEDCATAIQKIVCSYGAVETLQELIVVDPINKKVCLLTKADSTEWDESIYTESGYIDIKSIDVHLAVQSLWQSITTAIQAPDPLAMVAPAQRGFPRRLSRSVLHSIRRT